MMFLPYQLRRFNRSIAAYVLWPILAACLGLVSCSALRSQRPLSLSTGSPTGYYYQLGQVLEASAEATVDLEVDVLESKGSIENLERLLAGEIDFALVQLDVAKAAMNNAEVEAIAVLAQEHIHLIGRRNLGEIVSSEETIVAEEAPAPTATTLSDLEGRSVAVGAPGSGIRFTAEQLLSAAQLDVDSGQIDINEAGFSEALSLLSTGELDAAFYVGRLGASEAVRNVFIQDPTLTLVPLPPGLVNFLSTQNPGVYRGAVIPMGTYGVRPDIPERKLTTLSTPTVLITRPDTNEKAVQLMTWSIVATARRYSSFYPELQTGDPNLLLRQGLFYVHPGATQVYESGDPRRAWIRYWEDNSDLQAGIFLLIGTSGMGMLLRRWRRQRSQHLVDQTNARIGEISKILTDRPQEAMRSIQELDQDNRLQFIAGNISDEVYNQVQQRTQSFSDQCSSILDKQRRDQILETLLLLDDWQETLQSDPDLALQKLGQIRQQYREMLLSNQVDIQAYMELVELTLISVMTLVPQQREQADVAPALREY